MTPKRSRAHARPGPISVGAIQHGNQITLILARSHREVVGVEQFALTEGLPTHPYHHEGAWALGRYVNSPWARPVTLAEALQLIDEVTQAALAGAQRAIAACLERAPSTVSQSATVRPGQTGLKIGCATSRFRRKRTASSTAARSPPPPNTLASPWWSSIPRP